MTAALFTTENYTAELETMAGKEGAAAQQCEAAAITLGTPAEGKLELGVKNTSGKEIDEVVLIYTSFISTMEQEVKNEVILPFAVETDPEFMTANKFVEYEPSVEAVFNYLVPKYVETKIYSAVVESATCEHAARRMAMENATDNAREMLDDLNLNYNRARQSAITDEIIEIVAGSEAQS